MKTLCVTWNEKDIVVETLKKGGIVLFPTETVYGIACISGSDEALTALQQAKGRPQDKPFTLMCASLAQAVEYAEVNLGISASMKAFMPGEVTYLLKAREGVSSTIDFHSGVIGVRVPNSPEVLSLIEAVGQPLLVSSANRSGEKPALSFEEAKSAFGGSVAVIVEGECVSDVPSTVMDFTDEKPRLVRQGNVKAEEITRVYQEAKSVIALGSDHGGFAYKEEIKKHLSERGYEVLDYGCESTKSVDYPLYGRKVGEAVANKEADFGVVVCTSGEGISIAANKVRGVRCGIGYDDVVVGKMREHNNANVIAFGQKYMKLKDVLRRVDIFLTEKFSLEEKHHRRVDELE